MADLTAAASYLGLVAIFISGAAVSTVLVTAGKLLLHRVTMLSFLGGGVSGVLAHRKMGPLFIFGAAVALLLLALPGIIGKRESALPQPNAE